MSEKLYFEFLKDCEEILGNGLTSTDQLYSLGKRLFGEKFTGVFARDKIPPRIYYAIVNLDTEKNAITGAYNQGTHWIALCNDKKDSRDNALVHDSFGRVIFANRERTEDDVEQAIDDLNCGCHAMAFICVYEHSGRAEARKI